MRYTILSCLVLASCCNVAKTKKDPTPTATTKSSSTPIVAPAEAETTPAPKIYPSRPTIFVQSREILNTYGENEVRADSKYKDRFVQIRGKVDDVKKDLRGKIYVTIGTGANFEIPQIQCFAKRGEEDAFASLNKGQEIIVSGRVDGLMMNVLVKDCEIDPDMKRCEMMREFMGVGSCVPAKVSDPNDWPMWVDMNAGVGVTIMPCAATEEDFVVAVKAFSNAINEAEKQKSPNTVVLLKSGKTLCSAVLIGKKVPSAEVVGKVQAALDTMR